METDFANIQSSNCRLGHCSDSRIGFASFLIGNMDSIPLWDCTMVFVSETWVSTAHWLLHSREWLQSIAMSTSVCLSVCPQGYHRNHTAIFANFSGCCLGPCLGPLASLWYIMYFRFCGWDHVV